MINLSVLPSAVTAPRTGRLRLDRPEPGDLDAMWAIHSDPETNRHNPAGPLNDRREAERRLGEWIEHWELRGFGYWSVRDDDGIVGFAGLRMAGWDGRSVVNLYYRFTPAVWGRGYATEAAEASVELWRDRLSSLPLIAYTKTDNVGSQRTALAAGLERRPDLDQFTTDPAGRDIVFALGW